MNSLLFIEVYIIYIIGTYKNILFFVIFKVFMYLFNSNLSIFFIKLYYHYLLFIVCIIFYYIFNKINLLLSLKFIFNL